MEEVHAADDQVLLGELEGKHLLTLVLRLTGD